MKRFFTKKIEYLRQNTEEILIILFLATFTLNIRKVFLMPYSFLNGTFNEYLTISIGWADILMTTVIIIYTTKYIYSQFLNVFFTRITSNNNNKLLSIATSYNYVSRETIILILFLAWMGLSITWSQYKPISLYRLITFLEIAYFAFIAIRKLKNQKWLNLAIIAILANGLLQSLLGIAQFIHNSSLGFRFLGESIIGPNIDGVAKFFFHGQKHIRAYGTFPHPNILAGFLLIPIFIILTGLFIRSIFARTFNENVARETILGKMPSWLLIISLSVQIFGLTLTFSRSAFFGFVLGLLLIGFALRKYISKKFLLSTLSFLILMTIGFGFLMYLNKNSISAFSTQSLTERTLYTNVARETISTQPFLGVGIGQFVLNEFIKYPSLEGWKYQPVHSVYLLIFSELGISGLILFMLLLVLIFRCKIRIKAVSKLTLTYIVYYCIIYSFLFVSLFDHYFWDIKSGIIIFTLPIIFLKITDHTEA
jgi:hypothetical protein